MKTINATILPNSIISANIEYSKHCMSKAPTANMKRESRRQDRHQMSLELKNSMQFHIVDIIQQKFQDKVFPIVAQNKNEVFGSTEQKMANPRQITVIHKFQKVAFKRQTIEIMQLVR